MYTYMTIYNTFLLILVFQFRLQYVAWLLILKGVVILINLLLQMIQVFMKFTNRREYW